MSVNAAQANSSNTETFLTALVTNVALLSVEVAIFTVLKRRLGRIYTPRTFLPPPEKRARELPPGLWRWIPFTLFSPSQDIIEINGLDAYLFVRFLKLLIVVFGVFWIVSWAALLPTYVVGIKHEDKSGLSMFSWGNLSGDPHRYSAHIILVYVFTFFLLFIIRREMHQFVRIRHQWLISKSHSRLAQARTVLITSVPDNLANEHDLRRFASFVPGGVERVWVYRDTRELNKHFDDRQAACEKLEDACAHLIRSATKAWAHRQKAHGRHVLHRPQKTDVEQVDVRSSASDDELGQPPPSREFLDELVPPAKRPRHRLGLLGLFGEKVDTYEWCKEEIVRTNKALVEGRKEQGERKSLGSAFVECTLQLGAHVLAQCVSYHEPLMMADKYIEISPKDMIWNHLDDGAYEVRGRYLLSRIATGGLIIGWLFPVAFLGSLSNLDELCDQLPGVRWVCNAPDPIPGLIEGVLPPLLLLLMMLLLPYILRALAWYECIHRYSLISLSVYKRYYAFLILNGFLIVTISSAISATITDIIDKPTQAIEELSSRLPEASTFFLTYIVTQGFTGAASALIQLGPLIVHHARKVFQGRTPRQAYNVTFLMPAADFGTDLPRISLLATIGIVYSVMAPIINGLATVAFALLFLAWKFLITQVFDQPDIAETGGLYFPLAVTNLYVGLYIEQVALACLFLLDAGSSPKLGLAGAVLMLILLFITALSQILVHRSFDPLADYLPMSLATKELAERYGSAHDHEAQDLDRSESLIDLFSRERLKSVLRRRRKGKHGNNRQVTSDEDGSTLAGTEEASKWLRPSEACCSSMPTTPISDSTLTPTSTTHLACWPASPSTSAPSTPTQAYPDQSFSGLRIDPASPSLKTAPNRKTTSDSLECEDVDEDLSEHAFDHPSTYVDQPWIWIPNDSLGFGEMLAKDLEAAGVGASCVGTNMDAKGVVEVSRGPPDEEWGGGHDL